MGHAEIECLVPRPAVVPSRLDEGRGTLLCQADCTPSLAEIVKPVLGIVAALLIYNLQPYRMVVSTLIPLSWIVPDIIDSVERNR